MKSLIDAIEQELKNSTVTSRVHVESFGPTQVIPDRMPYINIVPRSKSRERQFFIGTSTKQYDVEPEVEIHVWESSMTDLSKAFEKANTLAEEILDFLADVTAATLGVDWHESQIEEYNDFPWEQTNYYEIVILFKAKKQESHT
jgi:hypothetical protein